jgi:hypothetical protein
MYEERKTKMISKVVAISEVTPNPDNPRTIQKDAFEKLVQSVSSFEKMLELRPIVVDSNMVILGGNMRYEACKAAGIKRIPIIIADDLTDEQKREFIIKDNVSGGEWDWEKLANEWDCELLCDWGLDVPVEFGDEDETYTNKIDKINYEPTGDTPDIKDLYDETKTFELKNEINKSDVTEEEKKFLNAAADRHKVFNYSLIAEYYAHANKNMQELMEKSALIIIDYEQAIELGYVELTKEVAKRHEAEYGSDIDD